MANHRKSDYSGKISRKVYF